MDGDDEEEPIGGVAVVGVCPYMCPVSQAQMREERHEVNYFEMDPSTVGTKDTKIVFDWAVKKYNRAAAGLELPGPEDIRPPPVLKVYHFMRDRTRSIRQDFTFQRTVSREFCETVEFIVRFHIIAEHRLSETKIESFNPQMNMEQMNKCLISLREQYNELRDPQNPFPNEAEMRAYYILTHFRSESETAREINSLRPEIILSAPVQSALRLYRAYMGHNYAQYFNLVRKMPYLQACLATIYFVDVRKEALKILCHAARASPEVPLTELVRILGFDSTEAAVDMCAFFGLNLNASGDCVVMALNTFVEPSEKKYPRTISHSIVEAKNTLSNAALIRGSSVDIDFSAASEAERAEALQKQREVAELMRKQREAAEALKRQQQEQTELLRKQQQAAEALRKQQEAADALKKQEEEQKRRVEEERKQREKAIQAQQEQHKREVERQRQLEEEARAEQQQAAMLIKKREDAKKEKEAKKQREEEAARAKRKAEQLRRVAAMIAAERAKLLEIRNRELENMRSEDRRSTLVENNLRALEQKRRRKAQKLRAAQLKLTFSRWFKTAKEEKEKRLLVQKREAFRSHVRRSLTEAPTVPPVSIHDRLRLLRKGTEAGASASIIERYAQWQRMRQAATLAREKADKRDALFRTPLDVASLVYPIISELNEEPMDLFWKVGVSLGDCADRRVGQWLRAKLSRGAVEDDLLFSDYRVERRNLGSFRSGYLHICFRDADNSDEQDMGGTQAVIVLIDRDGVQNVSSLRQHVKDLSADFTRPVLLIVSAGPSSTIDPVKLERDIGGEHGIINACIINDRNLAECNEALAMAVVWLSSVTERQPAFELHSVSDFTEQRLESHLFVPLQPIFAPSTLFGGEVTLSFPEVVNIYHDLLESIGTEIQVLHSTGINWPAPEFVSAELPSRGWQTAEAIEELQQFLQELALPDPVDCPDEPSTIEDRIEWVVEYVQRFVSGSDAILLLGDVVSTLRFNRSVVPWHRVLEAIVAYKLRSVKSPETLIARLKHADPTTTEELYPDWVRGITMGAISEDEWQDDAESDESGVEASNSEDGYVVDDESASSSMDLEPSARIVEISDEEEEPAPTAPSEYERLLAMIKADREADAKLMQLLESSTRDPSPTTTIGIRKLRDDSPEPSAKRVHGTVTVDDLSAELRRQRREQSEAFDRIRSTLSYTGAGSL